MFTQFLATDDFRYFIEVRKLERPALGYLFSIASTLLTARDPSAKRITLQLTLNAEGLRAIRNHIDSAVEL